MYKKACYVVIALLTYLANVESNKITFLKTVESFDTLKLLTGLKKTNGTSSCGRDVGEFLSDLGSGKYWASVSE